jgi:fructokinase
VLRLGVDLGGTKIEAVIVRLPDAAEDRSFEVVARVRRPTEASEGYDRVVQNVAAAIADVTREAGLGTAPPIGVGMPGSVTRAGLVKNSNTTCLNGRAFRTDLAMQLGVPIAFANDANCFALAEATLGEARGDVVFGVIMGTGVGGGVVLHGRAWDGAQGIAGEWGHVVLDPIAGPPCYCGKRGCIETYLSGPAIEARYLDKSGTPRKLVEIAARRGEDEAARGTLAEVIEVFGRALSVVIDVLDPEVVVLGGGVSNLALLYDEGIASVARWIFNDELRTRIVKHTLGDSAGVLGAALLSP